MRRTWAFLGADGRFTGRTFSGRARDLVSNTPESATAVEVTATSGRLVVLATGEDLGSAPGAPAATPERLGASARARRSYLLSASDWVVTRAAELQQPVPEAWLTYRAALRDLPAQPGFPTSIHWPVPPA